MANPLLTSTWLSLATVIALHLINPIPLAYEDLGIPEFTKPSAKPTQADADVANLLSKLPLKDGTIAFNIDLEANPGSDITKAIDPIKVNFIATIIIWYLRF